MANHKQMTLRTTIFALGVLLCLGASCLDQVDGQTTGPNGASSSEVKPQTVRDNKPEPLDDFNFGLFPQVIECKKEHEMPAPGKLSDCEPTCANPRPACLKIFHVGLDFVPCFCKSPMVRHPKTKLCVNVSECSPNN